jgi:transposase
MVFLDAAGAEKLETAEARKAALKYSNLCRANIAVIAKQEKILKVLAQALGEKNQVVLFAQDQLGQMKGALFGKSTEKRKGETGPLFGEKEEEKEIVKYERKKKREKFGRTDQPELPRVEVIHELPEAEVEAQNLKKMEGQFEVSELINVTPAKFVVEEHKRQKYVPVEPEKAELEAPVIVTAPGPLKLKDGCRYSIEFGVETGVSKYQWHLPLDRQVRMMESCGLACTSQVLYAQIDTIAWYLKAAVMPGIVARIKSSRVNLGDETYLENLAKDAKSRFWLWSVMSKDAVLFEVYDSRAKRAAQEFLKDLEGVLLTDGYYVYKSLASDRLVLANDWVHVRRKFIAAEKTHVPESKWFLDHIRALFKIEENMKGHAAAEVLATRQLLSRPIVDAIGEKCKELEPTTLSQSPLGRAVRYTLKLWGGLNVFLNNAEVPIDTNGIERVQRAPVVGRKNYYGAKTLVSARVAAVWHSVIQTCIISGVDPREYIHGTLRAILTKQPVIMPWDWPNRAGATAQAAATQGESTVSETAAFETLPGLMTKPAENSSIPGSKAVS